MDITVRAISGAILLERRFPHTVFGQEVLVLALQQLSADGPGVAKLFHGTTRIDTFARLAEQCAITDVVQLTLVWRR